MTIDTLDLLAEQPYFLLCYGLMACAALAIWVKPNTRVWWTLFYTASAGVGLWRGILTENAVILMGIFWALSYYGYANFKPRSRMMAQVVMISLTGLLLLHYFEGFEPWIIVRHLHLGHRYLPFTHFVFYEHAFIGVCLLGMGALPNLIRHYPEWKVMFRDAWPIAVTAIVSIYVLAGFSDHVDIDWGWTHYLKIFAFTNLFFVCIAEEAIFRGMIQRPMTSLFERWNIGKVDIGPSVAMIITVGLYSLRHYYSGLEVMIYAMLTGTFYAYAYMKTRRVEACIFVHWCVNVVHFLSFTYPMLA